MPTPIMGDIPILNNLKNASLEDMRDHLGKLQDYLIQQQRDQTYLLSTLDFENIFAVGGWRVNPDRIQSKDADVGMSTEDTAADDIRFWAGDVITGAPLFYVTKSGKLFAYDGTFVGTITADSGTIGGWIISAAGLSSGASYPRIELNSVGNLLIAYLNAANHLDIVPDFLGVPGITFTKSGTVVGNIEAGGSFTFGGSGTEIDIISNLDVNLVSTSGNVVASSLGGTIADIPTAINNLTSAVSALTAALSGKVNTGSTTSTAPVHDHGIPAGTLLAISGGGSVAWAPSGSHSHTV